MEGLPEVMEDRQYPNRWRVEQVVGSAVEVAVFSGPRAENRAKGYAKLITARIARLEEHGQEVCGLH